MKTNTGCCLLTLALLLCAGAAAHAQHERAFWRSITATNYAVPEHESPDALAPELSSLLASPDPELRDDLAYSILARWIYRGNFSKATLISLTDAWRANLKDGIGEQGTNSVLKRSFSALCLASMARREAREPFMGTERYHQIVAETIGYLQAERDLRGYDANLHWIHATAHTADLLAGLAGSSQMTRQELEDALNAVAVRLKTAPDVFTQGEQDRLAGAVIAILRRSEFDEAEFAKWLAGIEEEDSDVWTKTTPERLAHYQNHTYMMQALIARLALEPDSARVTNCKQKVLAVLKDRLD